MSEGPGIHLYVVENFCQAWSDRISVLPDFKVYSDAIKDVTITVRTNYTLPPGLDCLRQYTLTTPAFHLPLYLDTIYTLNGPLTKQRVINGGATMDDVHRLYEELRPNPVPYKEFIPVITQRGKVLKRVEHIIRPSPIRAPHVKEEALQGLYQFNTFKGMVMTANLPLPRSTMIQHRAAIIDNHYTVLQMASLCAKIGLMSTGTKTVIRERLLTYFSNRNNAALLYTVRTQYDLYSLKEFAKKNGIAVGSNCKNPKLLIAKIVGILTREIKDF